MGLKVGDVIPKFSAKDANGNLFESQSIIGKKAVIIYFYPKDNTSQCTAQACGFRDNYTDFVNLGVEIIGISSDDVHSHQEFIRKYNLPFLLLSDSDKAIRKLFGVPSDFFGLLPGRVTYLVDQNGVIQLVFNSMRGMKHVTKMIEKLTK
ncbi:peroxiredoxin [Flavobacterium seoulense]|uniref:thioredoxin-dependent peroxiredoxin n=1 Tax=Flavobacterium seoulense TaxID=1492738 RepID=A0A066WPN8_9FLAO|nr:peroxiredoxin [Flavobacterium seoulense]KDN56017.1 alkyl hydroperoxide reductase [Flavobacterium seoulense]